MQLFKEFDKDGDGTISIEEFMIGLKVWFVNIFNTLSYV